MKYILMNSVLWSFPHTYSNTIFKNYKIGSILNTEIDILAKYIEKLGKE